MDPELGGDGPYPPVLDEVVAQDLRLELVVERHRARCSVPGATPSASSYRRATPLPTDELADRARAEVAVHLGSAARCASSLDGRFGRHRRIGLAHRNSMRGEFSIARGASGTVMRHFVRARAFAAPAPVAPLALGMTVPAAPRVLIPASRPAQRFTPSEAAAARPAVVLAPVTARADEHLAPASGTEKQSGIVHRSSRRGGLDDPRLPGNTAFGAVRKCGSGRSLGRDRQVSAVRGCVGLLADSDLTPTHERRHRRYARCARPLAGSIGSGGKPRHVPGGRGGTIQRWFASTGTVSSRGLFAIYPRIFTATNTQIRGPAVVHRHAGVARDDADGLDGLTPAFGVQAFHGEGGGAGRVAPGDCSPEVLSRTGQGDFHHPAPPLMCLVAMPPISAPPRADGETGSVPVID